MTPEDRIQRGREALFVLENPIYQEAHGKFVHDIRALRLQLGPRDVEGAHRLVLMEQAVEKGKKLLEQYMQDAETAKKELEKVVYPGPIGRLNAKFRSIR